jgi:hypothetical protein
MLKSLIGKLLAIVFVLSGVSLFAADYLIGDLYDPLDPRIPGTKSLLLSRLEIANCSYQSLDPRAADTSNAAGFNRRISEYLARPSRHWLNLSQDDFHFEGDLRAKLNWLDIK